MKKLEIINHRHLPQSKDYLWRYFDLHKFLNLLFSQRIRFTRMDQFEDPLEGIPLKALFTYHTKVDKNLLEAVSLSELLLDNTLNDFVPEEVQSRLRTIRAIQMSCFITCWFAEQKESMAMWNLYSNADGVAVKIPFGKLVKQLKVEHDDLSAYYGGMVDYHNIRSLYSTESERASITKVALRKDISFKHECEFRFVVRVKNHKNELSGIDSLPLNLSSMGIKVICHPRMPAWKKNNVLQMLKLSGLEDAYEDSKIFLR